MKPLLLVEMPPGRAAMRRYALDVVLGEFLGFDYVLTTIDAGVTRIRMACDDAVVQLSDNFLGMDEALWLRPESIPTAASLATFDAASLGPLSKSLVLDHLPILFSGRHSDTAKVDLPIDVFGSAFFMLSRYEELAVNDRDEHDRFPGRASIAAHAGFIERPLLDEYVELIWALLSRTWPTLSRKAAKGFIIATCDVDFPYDPAVQSTGRMLRALSGDLLRRRSPSMAARRLRNALAGYRGDYSFDPMDTFDWYLSTCARHNRPTTFYFIAGHSGGSIDGSYEILEPRILALLKKIAAAGSTIGMHGSYNTFRDQAQLVRERRALTYAMRAVGLADEPSDNRQHFLRWDSAETPDNLLGAGFTTDSTGGFADLPGFRFGTARTFPMWGWKSGTALTLRQQPLIMMESSVIADHYLGLGYTPAALATMQTLRENALRFGGDFRFLWHNSHLTTAEDRDLFEAVIG